jgi:hypothetical protein
MAHEPQSHLEGGVARPVSKLMYEILPDEEFVRIDGDNWSWSGELGNFQCSIGQDKPPYTASFSSHAMGDPEPPQVTSTEPGPTLIARPQFAEPSVPHVRSIIEPLLAGWATHLDLTENTAIRFSYRGAWTCAQSSNEDLVEYRIEGGDSFKVYRPLREAPAPPPDWLDAEPEMVRLLRDQWRAVRDGNAKLLDRAYFCLTAIEDAYGGRSAAASQLQVSGGLLSRIGQLAASPDRKHARKLTGRGPTEISADDRDWLNKALPRLIYRCAEVEMRRPRLPVLTSDSSTW